MTAFFDFLIRALPWIAIGLFVACSCVAATTKSEGKKLSRIFRGGGSWFPALCFLFVAIMDMCSGNISRGTTWLMLGICNAVFNFSNTQNKRK